MYCACSGTCEGAGFSGLVGARVPRGGDGTLRRGGGRLHVAAERRAREPPARLSRIYKPLERPKGITAVF